VIGEVPKDRGLHAKDRKDLGVAQADHAVVQHGFQRELLRILVHRHGQVRLRARYDLERSDLHLEAARGLVVGRHLAEHDHHRLRGHLRLAVQHALGRARAIAQQQEGALAQLPHAVHPAAHLDLFARVLRDFSQQRPHWLPP
jgi:hypothetical protein